MLTNLPLRVTPSMTRAFPSFCYLLLFLFFFCYARPLRGIDGRAFFPAGRGSRPAARRPGRLRPGHHSHYRPGLPVVRALSLGRRATVSAARFYHLHRRRRARRTAHDRLLPPPSSHGRRRARTEPTTPSLPPPPHGKRRARTGAHDPVSSPLIPRQAASEDGSPRHRLFPPSLCKPTRAAPPDGRWWPAIPPVGRFGAPRSGWGRETPRLATLLKRSRAGHPRLPPPPPALRRGKAPCPSSGWPLQSFKKSGPGTRARGQEPDGGSPPPGPPARHLRQNGAGRPAPPPTLAGTRSTTTRWTTACCCRNSEDKRLPPVLPATPDGRRATRTTPESKPTSTADGHSRASAARTSRRRSPLLLSIPSRSRTHGPTSIHWPELDHC